MLGLVPGQPGNTSRNMGLSLRGFNKQIDN